MTGAGVKSSIIAASLGIAICAAAWAAAGATLGLFIAGLFVAAVCAGPLVLAENTWPARFCVLAGLVCGIGVVWLAATAMSGIGVGRWLACDILLAAMTFALGGIATFLRRLHLSNIAAGAISSIAGLLWLTCPIWLSGTFALAGGVTLLRPLLAIQPLLTLNGVLPELGIWTEQSLAYHLTDLNRTMVYSLPTSVLPSVFAHALAGLVLVLLSARRPSHPREHATEPAA